MSNAMYSPGIDGLMTGAIDLDTDTLKVVLVKNSYTFSAAHQYLSSISAGDRAATASLSGVTVSGGVFDASDVTFTAVAAGGTCNALVIYKDTGSAASSNLLCYIDTATGSPGLPVAPNGGDIPVTWNNGANKILKIG